MLTLNVSLPSSRLTTISFNNQPNLEDLISVLRGRDGEMYLRFRNPIMSDAMSPSQSVLLTARDPIDPTEC